MAQGLGEAGRVRHQGPGGLVGLLEDHLADRRRTRRQAVYGLGASNSSKASLHEPLGRRPDPRGVAAHLAPYAAAWRTATDWLTTADTVLPAHGRHGWRSPTHVTSPGGWVYWLTQRMTLGASLVDEPGTISGTDLEDAAGRGPADHSRTACDRGDCDHGWLTTASPTGTYTAASCSICTPAARGLHDLDVDLYTWDHDEPPSDT